MDLERCASNRADVDEDKSEIQNGDASLFPSNLDDFKRATMSANEGECGAPDQQSSADEQRELN